jgi:hypothetical protein
MSHGSSAHGVLHPTPSPITNRPQATRRDPAELFPEMAPSQVAILLTKSGQDAEPPVRCLKAMGIPFFVTRDLRTALRHHLLVLHPEVDGKTFDGVQAKAITDFIVRGGVVFAQDVLWGGFKPLFGFDDVLPLRTRHKIIFDAKNPDAADPVFRCLNRGSRKRSPAWFRRDQGGHLDEWLQDDSGNASSSSIRGWFRGGSPARCWAGSCVSDRRRAE